MSQKDSPHDFDPKHRIIGAIVIVALAVVFVPMILSKREPPAETPPSAQSQAPDQPADGENKVAVTRVAPPPPALNEPVKIPPTTSPAPDAPKTATPPPAKATPPAPAPEQPKKAAVEPKPSAPTAKAPSESKPATASSGWVVQVGTFSNSTNANRLEQKLRAEGQPVRAERVQLDSGKAVRLRVGPFRDRAAAVKAQERIQKDVGIKGVVLAYP